MASRTSTVAAALAAAGATGEIRELDQSARTAALAAEALGVDVWAIASSLVFRSGEQARHDVVWAPAGSPRTVFATSYDELLRLTGGTATEVG